MGQTPLLSFHLLADQQLKPGAIEICVGPGDAEDCAALIAETAFAGLIANFPCLVSSQTSQHLPPACIDAMTESGIVMCAEGAIHRADGSARPVLPPSAQWLAGDWSIAEPAKASGNQTVSRALSLKLLQKVADDADTCEIEAIFRQDPVLAYHLLRLVNSFGVGVGRTVSSFSQAILILGRQQLKRWLNLMLFAANRDDHRSTMLLARVAVRARSLELLAKAGGMDRSAQEYAFMAGMFSLLGCLFGMPLAEVLKPLKLPDALADGLLHHTGNLGVLLDLVEKAERADLANQRTPGIQADGVAFEAQLTSIGLSMADYVAQAIEAHRWMRGVINEQDATHA